VSVTRARAAYEPVAIVGMGCRFPGATGPAALWQMLSSGSDQIAPMPDRRLGLDGFYDPTPGAPGKYITREGGFLQNVELFDAAFFGISPREAVFVDPQQRLLLEITWEAFEDAGIVPSRLAGSEAGVFVGMWTNEYEDYVYGATADVDLYVTTGGGRHSASGRLAYIFDLRGPTLTLDTACSSSIVALHLACRSLASGESELAIAGGVNLILQPHISIGYSRSGMLSPRARCRFGDATADGYVRSEGAGVVVLKTLARAVADGDRIHAVVLGSAVNNDGRSSDLLVAPSVIGQQAMLREAYRAAGVSPGDVQYVEAHGTGTRVGDPVELQALSSVLSQGRAPERQCLVGSIKTNIGHAEAASGVAGLMKTVLAMQHGVIPASLHLEHPNANIPWSSMPMTVARERQAWPSSGQQKLAGVNSFGITGTNAHVVLAEAPVARVTTAAAAAGPRVLLISAHTPAALRQLAGAYVEYLTQADQASLDDICTTAALRRTHHEHRATVVASTTAEAADHLQAFLAGETRAGLATAVAGPERAHKVVFIFPGQGSQWLGMARSLSASEPAFAEALRRCDTAVRHLTGWSVIDELHAPEAASRLTRIDVIQPVLFSVQVALAALWRSWGVEPTAVVGHSMGEIAAAHVAGALSIEDAASIICRRSELLRRTSGKGAMAVVELSLDEAAAAVAEFTDRLSVAVSNSARSTVISGEPAALETLLTNLERREIFCRRVKVDVASHSPQMDPLRADLLAAIQHVTPQAAPITFCSTVLSQPIAGTDLTAEYWVRNLREPVLFAGAIRRLLSEGHDTFIEISPHPLLVSAIEETAAENETPVVALPSMRRDEDERAIMRASAGALHCHGRSVAWERVLPSASGRLADLPLFPWQRERFWFDAPRSSSGNRAVSGDLLGMPFRPSLQSSTSYFEFELAAEQFPFLTDHRVRGAVVVPAALFLELAAEGAHRILGTGALRFDDLAISKALILPERGTRIVQLAIAEAAGSRTFKLLSRDTDDGSDSAAWVEHASGIVSVDASAAASLPGLASSVEARCSAESDADAHYAVMARRGLGYGPAFRAVERVFSGTGELFCRIRAPKISAGSLATLQRRTSLLDACLQAVVAALPSAGAGDTYVPVSVERLTLRPAFMPAGDLGVHVTRTGMADETGDAFAADLQVLDASGAVVAEATRVTLRRIERERDAQLREAMYRFDWLPQSRTVSAATQNETWLILADAVSGRVIADRIRARGARAVLVTSGQSFSALGADHFQVDPASEDDAMRVCAAVPAVSGVAYLWNVCDGDSPLTRDVRTSMGAVHVIKALTASDATRLPRVWLVTAGTQSITGAAAVAGSALWGLRSVVAGEYPKLRCSVIDVNDIHSEDVMASLVDECLADGAEDEVALLGRERFVRRLARGVRDDVAAALPGRPAVGRPFRAVTAAPGMLDALVLQEVRRREPGPNEVEIEVVATGLNFMNVMSALGICPGYPNGAGPLGIECAGRVARTGRDVRDLHPGDAVMAFAHHSLATHALADRVLVRRVPEAVTFRDAATIPLAFLTAYYALVHLGRLAPGERVLIHAAAGGVGLAALQIAQAIGAQVYATAGSDEKRALLRSLGVAHVADSRSLSFADDIRTATGGEGVDVVLNSLAGEAIDAGIDLLRGGGRFLEIGKRDIYDNRAIGLLPFRRNLSYFAIDLDRISRDTPQLLGPTFDQVVAKFADGTYRPLPVEAYPVDRLQDAFRRMAQGHHTGKIVLEIDAQGSVIRPSATAVPEDWETSTVLVTGGTGALGLAICDWMADQGARHFVLVSRRGEDAAASTALARLRERGATVTVYAGDVTRSSDVERIIAAVDASPMPALRGVIHAAGLLDDATIGRLDSARFERVAAPKIAGAWNLHVATSKHSLDFFVLFSSVTSFIGSSGQAGYAAANAFLDSLAEHRRAQGLPAISIGWGPWSDIGLAAAGEHRGSRLADAGLGSLAPDLGVTAFGELLRLNPPHTAVMHFDVERWCQAYPAFSARPLFAALRDATRASAAAPAAATVSVRASLEDVPPGRRRRSLLESYLQQQVAHVLKLAPSRVEVGRAFRTLGLDSLMGLELRNRLEAGTGTSLPATLIWNHPTVTLLATEIARRMGVALDESAESSATDRATESLEVADADAADVEALLENIEDLSDDEARRLLAEER
jgi:acyl transferase domain-containing protein/NADPH:quinone reductase-like Zn-dependent oxidoreductase